MSKFENKYMKMAIKEAEKGIEKGDGGPFGAVIVKDGKVVGKGHNKVLKNNDPTCHGEIEAIRNACKKLKTYDLSGCMLFTTHYPCPMCLGAIRWSNIDEIFYGCSVDDTDKIGFRDKEFYEEQTPIKLHYLEYDRDKCLELSNKYMNMEHTLY